VVSIMLASINFDVMAEQTTKSSLKHTTKTSRRGSVGIKDTLLGFRH